MLVGKKKDMFNLFRRPINLLAAKEVWTYNDAFKVNAVQVSARERKELRKKETCRVPQTS